ncbi:MAG: gamma-glutamyltransferase family protein, partial [bacterium]|nr:gamma-glutamyltransferase family protein [bacterium]
FGDPEFVKVPIKGLLDPGYAAERRKQLTPGKAFGKMPAHGSPSGFQAGNQNIKGYAFNPVSHKNNQLKIGRDTSYICIVDSAGNAVSLTPSDFPQTPMVPGTGLTLGNRMTQFRLDPKHPTALMPGKRPRISPNPGMVLKNGKFFMTFGTPGDDMQPQAMIQVFLNITVFGMDPQEAIDAPRFRSFNFPASFAPHQYRPGVVEVEKSIYNSAGDKLKKMGYSIVAMEKWDNRFGAVCAIIKDQTSGNLIGGADPREESWAGGR